MSEDNYLVSYIPKIDYDTVTSHYHDFIIVVSKYKDSETQFINATSIVISAAVTAYARIHMNKLKLDILKQGGNFYSDTDSIVTDKVLDKSLLSFKELGLLKLEHEIDKGILISNKTYFIRDVKGTAIVKAKGMKSSSVSYKDFVDFLNNKNVETAVERQSKTYWYLGYVSIENKDKIKINFNSYTKREKIFNSDNHKEWINTKPLVICYN